MRIEVRTATSKLEGKFWVKSKYRMELSETLAALESLSENSWLEVSGFDDWKSAYNFRMALMAGNRLYFSISGTRLRTRMSGHNGDLKLLIGKEYLLK